MSKLIVLLIFSLSFGWFVFAQNNNDETEKASPMQNAELIRKVCFLDIEGEVYTDVVVAIKSISPDGFFSDKYRVKVKVTDSNGKTVWNKTMKTPIYMFFQMDKFRLEGPNSVNL